MHCDAASNGERSQGTRCPSHLLPAPTDDTNDDSRPPQAASANVPILPQAASRGSSPEPRSKKRSNDDPVPKCQRAAKSPPDMPMWYPDRNANVFTYLDGHAHLWISHWDPRVYILVRPSDSSTDQSSMACEWQTLLLPML